MHTKYKIHTSIEVHACTWKGARAKRQPVGSAQGSSWGFGALLKGTSAVFRTWTGTSPANSPHTIIASSSRIQQFDWSLNSPSFPTLHHSSAPFAGYRRLSESTSRYWYWPMYFKGLCSFEANPPSLKTFWLILGQCTCTLLWVCIFRVYCTNVIHFG